MKRASNFFVWLLGLIFYLPVAAQFKQSEARLISALHASKTEIDKLARLDSLAEFYFYYQKDRLADSVLQLQISTAEVSENKDLLIKVLFGSSINNIIGTKNVNSWRNNSSLIRAQAFIEKGLNYSKNIQREDFAVLSHVRLSQLFKSMGQYDKAFYHAGIASTMAGGVMSDSIKAVANIQLGDVYLARGEALLAFKNFTNAYDLSVAQKNKAMQSEIYHRYADLYAALGNNDLAKENLFRSLEINKSGKKTTDNVIRQINDYIELARLTDQLGFVEKALFLADSIKSEKSLIQAKRLMYGYYNLKIKNADSTIDLINRNPDLKEVYFNAGPEKYHSVMGSIYQYSGMYDSAIVHMKIAESTAENTLGATSLQSLYSGMAASHYQLQHTDEAIKYYLKALQLANELHIPGQQKKYNALLADLYENKGDFATALVYFKKTKVLGDSLQALADQRSIALLEVENEKKAHELILEQEQKKEIVKANLQYMGITIIITLIFAGLIITGMFPVSKFTIKALGYFAFISLFEFIILILDKFLHDLAHGAPLKIWGFKILIIAMIMPLHHILEHSAVKFIMSHKLQHLRNLISYKNIIGKLRSLFTDKPDATPGANATN